MDKLIEILWNSMRNNSSDVDAKLTTFMEEAPELHQLGGDAGGDRAPSTRRPCLTAASLTAAKLCDKMALFMVEGTKFRSLLLNMLQVTGADSCAPAPPARGGRLWREGCRF